MMISGKKISSVMLTQNQQGSGYASIHHTTKEICLHNTGRPHDFQALYSALINCAIKHEVQPMHWFS